jgi:hypothetical protein
MDDINKQLQTITSQISELQRKFSNLGTLPGMSQDMEGAIISRIFQRATALPATYTKTLGGSPSGVTVLAPCDFFYEIENGVYVPAYYRIT